MSKSPTWRCQRGDSVPEPVITHVIGTVVLLSAALLTVASVTIIQQINYVQTLNAMLAEAAESCARQIVELVSIHTIGGGDYTYMALTLPQSLGGQPYNITLENVGENMLMVIAQLQLHRQVRIVVTPNFGQAPVFAVSTTMKFGDLIVSPTILLPTPQGWKAALVAFKSSDSILIGFTSQPPVSIRGASPPSCRFLDWTRNVVGLAGSETTLSFVIYNRGDAPSWMTVEVVDDWGAKIGVEKIMHVESNEVVSGSIPVQLVMPGGVYNWNLVCTPDEGEPTSVMVVVEVQAPVIEVVDVTSLLVGEAGSNRLLNITLKNVGKVKGKVNLILDGRILSEEVLQPGETKHLSLSVQLPRDPGSHSATLMVHVVETRETQPIPITIVVIGNDPYIASVNNTIVGFPGWQPKLYVTIANPSDFPVTVSVAVDNNELDIVSLSAKESKVVVVQPTLPARRGIYTWQVSLLKGGTVVSKANVLVEVRDIKEVKRNIVFVERGSYNLKDEDKICGTTDQPGKKRRCVTTLTLSNNLGGHLPFGVWIAANVHFAASGNVYKGVSLLSNNRLYEVSALEKGNNVNLFLWALDTVNGQWSLPAQSGTGRMPDRGYYPIHMFAQCDGAMCRFNASLYGTSPQLTIRGNFQGDIPTSLSLLVDDGTGTFSDIIVTRGDSRYLIVQGLPPGWIVELWDGSELIDRSADGVLLVATRYIIKNARLRFIDPYNKVFTPDRSLGELFGGDVVIISNAP